MSETINGVLNDSSLVFYRVNEHIHKKVPILVQEKVRDPRIFEHKIYLVTGQAPICFCFSSQPFIESTSKHSQERRDSKSGHGGCETDHLKYATDCRIGAHRGACESVIGPGSDPANKAIAASSWSATWVIVEVIRSAINLAPQIDLEPVPSFFFVFRSS